MHFSTPGNAQPSSTMIDPHLILHSHTQPTRKYHFNRIEE
jgi:hypothetical protein